MKLQSYSGSGVLPRLAALACVLMIGLAPLPAYQQSARADTGPAPFSIAPTDQALTFARYRLHGEVRTLAVTGGDGSFLQGMDLGPEDPVTLFARLGYEALEHRVVSNPGAETARVSVDTLILPLELAASHIAAGANFPEHANEATVEEGPFLFAKQVQPTPWNAAVSAGKGLLDYEVEIAWVSLGDIPLGSSPEHLGLVLCNDFTDRALLLRNLDPWDIESGKGFTTGKSFVGALPVGPLLLIPRDYRNFVPPLHLALQANGIPRQSAVMRQAVWEIDEVLQQAWQGRGIRWSFAGTEVGLPVTDKGIPARTLLLGGTPSGTIFDGITMSQKLRGALRWLLGGWDMPLARQVIEVYIEDATLQSRFLQPGDTVQASADYLGVVRTRVAP